VRKSFLLSFLTAALVLPVLPAAHALRAAPLPEPRAGRCGDVFCAGAARADITPPITTPMWGYTARELADHSPTRLGDAAGKLAAGSPGDALSVLASDPWVADKTGGDAEGYCKTFECNQGIQTRLFANAFVLEDRNATKVAVVQVDLGGLPAEVHQAVADRVSRSVGIDAAHLLISATHTHQGPGGIFQYQGYALLGGDQFDPRVFAAVTGGIANAVERADHSRRPAKMAWAQMVGAPGNHNRRTEQFCLDPESHCGEAGALPSANDTLTVMRLDTVWGDPIGIISNFANHGTIGGDDNLLFSGDNQAFAVRDIEAGIAALADADAHGPRAGRAGSQWPIDALLNGSQGDQSPASNPGTAWPPGTPGVNVSYAAMEGAGKIQAPPALTLWRSLGDELTGDVTLDARMEQVCFCGQAVRDPGPNYDGDPLWDHVSASPMLGSGGVTSDAVAGLPPASSPVVVPTQGMKLSALAGNGTSPQATRLQQFRIGDLLIASMPGEPTVNMGRRIIGAINATAKGASTPIRGAIIAGLADDYVSYFTTHEEYRSYQYEASFSLYGPQEGQLLLEEHVNLTSALLQGTTVPLCTPTPVCPSVSYPAGAAVPPRPIGTDPEPSVLKQPAGAATQFDVVSFSWVGGSPSAEWAPDEDRVQVQRRTGSGDWVTVAGDARDYATLLTHATVAGQHQWTTSWDITREFGPGTYRFRITGHRATGNSTATPYTLTSNPVTVSAFTGACPPVPNPLTSFRFRDACAR